MKKLQTRFTIGRWEATDLLYSYVKSAKEDIRSALHWRKSLLPAAPKYRDWSLLRAKQHGRMAVAWSRKLGVTLGVKRRPAVKQEAA